MRLIYILAALTALSTVTGSPAPLNRVEFELSPKAYFLLCQVGDDDKLAAMTRLYLRNDSLEPTAITASLDKLASGKLPLSLHPKGELPGSRRKSGDTFTYELGKNSRAAFSEKPEPHKQLRLDVPGVHAYQLTAASKEKTIRFYFFFSDDLDAISKVFTPILGQGYVAKPQSHSWRGRITTTQKPDKP